MKIAGADLSISSSGIIVEEIESENLPNDIKQNLETYKRKRF